MLMVRYVDIMNLIPYEISSRTNREEIALAVPETLMSTRRWRSGTWRGRGWWAWWSRLRQARSERCRNRQLYVDQCQARLSGTPTDPS